MTPEGSSQRGAWRGSSQWVADIWQSLGCCVDQEAGSGQEEGKETRRRGRERGGEGLSFPSTGLGVEVVVQAGEQGSEFHFLFLHSPVSDLGQVPPFLQRRVGPYVPQGSLGSPTFSLLPPPGCQPQPHSSLQLPSTEPLLPARNCWVQGTQLRRQPLCLLSWVKIGIEQIITQPCRIPMVNSRDCDRV